MVLVCEEYKDINIGPQVRFTPFQGNGNLTSQIDLVTVQYSGQKFRLRDTGLASDKGKMRLQTCYLFTHALAARPPPHQQLDYAGVRLQRNGLLK
ncbi:hypothetical protein BaRGS_00022370 [Batillaria attramentaria]|uniref:Uncharacterized protein n=1 Tax=Batillaria attramentaria TaxID=370345 RepID=A0ABD0KH00_9CAEN